MPARFLPFFILLCCLAGGMLGGCANILPPSGGPKDTTAPRLLARKPADSGLNVSPKKITLRFDEYVVVADAATQIQISPLLAQNIRAEADLRTVTLTLPDTLLRPNTTYRIRLGTAIRDLHEDNPFRNYTYTFSTGSYFDSLTLAGRVWKAEAGEPDTAIRILLYEATASDSAILHQKPQYITGVDVSGNFRFSGLPNRPFRVYALGDKNDNLLFDKSDERIAFLDSVAYPAIADSGHLVLRSFVEKDTTDTTTKAAPVVAPNAERRTPTNKTSEAAYSVGVDTANIKRRTASLLQPVEVSFSGMPVQKIEPGRIFLTRDSNGVAVETPLTVARKPTDSSVLQMAPFAWQPNAVYTLRLLKGFATSGDHKALPGKWIFRTKSDEDYARLTVNFPEKYRNTPHILQVFLNDKDTVWQKPVETASLLLPRLEPGVYTLRLIEDRNRNGHWDPGNLLQKIHPERVFPLDRKVTLKAGWDNVVDWKSEE